jgi:hypothetical protein
MATITVLRDINSAPTAGDSRMSMGASTPAVNYNLGHLMIVKGPPDGGPPPPYFQCPLLPAKE